MKQSESHLESLALSEELDTPDKRTTALSGYLPTHLHTLSMHVLHSVPPSATALQLQHCRARPCHQLAALSRPAGPQLICPSTRMWCAGIMQKLREDGSLTGWRSESYPVLTDFHSGPLALVERAAAVHLGIKAYGVHVNGYVRGTSGIELWVARRSRSKPTWPGKLDHIVAGGQVHCQQRT